MKKKKISPCYQTLMPHVAVALNKLGGKAEKHIILYQVLMDLNLPLSAITKANKELGWAGSRLRKLGLVKPVSRKGTWELEDTLIGMDEELLIQVVRTEQYEALKENI